MRRSRAPWSAQSLPSSAGASTLFTLAMALLTPLPMYWLLSPSRSSSASKMPVEAPDGTAARKRPPAAVCTSTSTVGLPRLSKMARACTFVSADFAARSAVEARILFQEGEGGSKGSRGPSTLVAPRMPTT